MTTKLTVCGWPAEQFEAFRRNQQVQIYQTWKADKAQARQLEREREREQNYVHTAVMRGQALQHAMWINGGSVNNIGAVFQQILPPLMAPTANALAAVHPTGENNNGNFVPPGHASSPSESLLNNGTNNGAENNANSAANRDELSGRGTLPSGGEIRAGRNNGNFIPLGQHASASPNKSSLNNGNIAADRGEMLGSVANPGSATTPAENNGNNRPKSPIESLLSARLSPSSLTSSPTTPSSGRSSPNENVCPKATSTKTAASTTRVAFLDSSKDEGPNSISVEELRKRTAMTPGPKRHFSVKEAVNIQRLATPAAKGTADDVVELSSDDEDDTQPASALVEPVYKCCAGDECNLFKFDLKWDVLQSTHYCVDCEGRVHAPGQAHFLRDPCCLSLENDKGLLRRVKARVGADKANPVGCLCRYCFLAHYQAMPSPPPSPTLAEKELVWSCVSCLDFKVKSEFKSLEPFKSHPQRDTIVQAARDEGEALAETDFGDPICTECSDRLLATSSRTQVVQELASSSSRTGAGQEPLASPSSPVTRESDSTASRLRRGRGCLPRRRTVSTRSTRSTPHEALA